MYLCTIIYDTKIKILNAQLSGLNKYTVNLTLPGHCHFPQCNGSMISVGYHILFKITSVWARSQSF